MNSVLRLPYWAKAALGLLLFATIIFAVSLQFRRAGKPPIHQPKTAGEFEENAEARNEWFMRERTFPTGEIPADARRNAWASRPVDARLSETSAAPPVWQSIGPRATESDIDNWGLTSGRINAIAVSPSNPQLILVGAATGGIWRSIDGGANFSPTTDNQVDLSVGSIAFAPSDNSIVYAGLGDKSSNYFGSGVLKSTDGGQSWTRVSNATLPSPGRVSQIEVDSANPNRVYAAQYTNRQGNGSFASGFYYSIDGGVNWTKTIAGLARDLIKHPTQPNTLYLGMARVDGTTPTTGGVFKSDNGGQSWTRIYTAPFAATSNIKIAVTPAAPQSLYVLSGSTAPAGARLETSANEGGMWTNRGSNFDIGQLSYNFYLFVHPTNPSIIFVGTRDLWRSVNGGTNFTNITNNFSITGAYNPFNSRAHPDQHHFYISSSDPNIIYLANDGGFYKSTDGAGSFQSLNASLNLTMFTSLDLHPTDASRTYGGTQDNGNQRRRGGELWREFISGDGGQIVVDPIDPGIVYATYVRHVIDRWSSNTDVYDLPIGNSAVFNNDPVAFYPPFVGNDVNSNLYFGTNRLYISANRGLTWTPPAGALDLTFGGGDVLSAIAVAKSDTNVIYTGSSFGRAMVSTAAGGGFTQITNGLPARFIKSIVVSPSNPSVAYLTVSGFDSGHVFKTINAGANWTDISGNLPNIPTNTLVIDPRDPNTLYVGTDIGVFRSLTDGGTWETFNNGMPPVIVSELDINAGGLLQAGTYGRGAYQIDTAAAAPRAVADFDGDGKTDVSVFRPADGTWYLLRSQAGFTAAQFGANGDIPAAGDYDGDGKTDIAVYRPNGGFWFIVNSSNNTFRGQQFGISSDKPVANDFDGDGKTDIAVYRGGAWYSIYSSNSNLLATNFGIATDLPAPADFNGDGRAELAVYRDGTWYTLNLANNEFKGVQFGIAGDKPVVGDYDADGKDDYAVYRPTDGTWYVLRSTSGFFGQQFGIATDIPAAGDYDGDGKSYLAVYRPADGAWYIINSGNSSLRVANFGVNGDIPIPSRQNP
ncbi:MAG TPA: FG-GAP-like repeat-containing protein [Pyrinomonadaceae bacterium]